MTRKQMLEIMDPFRAAFRKASAAGLKQVLTTDFEWHMHHGEPGGDAPTGKVLVGVDEMIKELKWRRANWSEVSYSDLTEHPAGNLILQMFTTSGIDENDKRYNVNAVDVYTLRDGKICIKDTYWKNIKRTASRRQ